MDECQTPDPVEHGWQLTLQIIVDDLYDFIRQAEQPMGGEDD